MGNLGGMELLVILLVALIVLGPTKLPEAARQVGKAVNELRRLSSGFQR
ncbi:MAG: twin-arginine translocase TatA/TatE family subunit, partial [Actinobacteria bacterium]|nr:twin-arginine translocase TatA/TatE family subunit [Actinomycetota bacterium]NIS28609.1 twin-arginine translocase TatA/TatE family subunit [Actinomycetota bacterium]NIT94047.1 twin-arginine translocase TatA/TatE family subunit [Actinomycetota bacterium]NIU17678.1 twin-arginine translocase TatA/TatE family subunit [Actinomycetota bacterium]NIU64072.1 twin-arginine translocase TatA/TatE family subunit [Actinomycetota bacterium]